MDNIEKQNAAGHTFFDKYLKSRKTLIVLLIGILIPPVISQSTVCGFNSCDYTELLPATVTTDTTNTGTVNISNLSDVTNQAETTNLLGSTVNNSGTFKNAMTGSFKNYGVFSNKPSSHFANNGSFTNHSGGSFLNNGGSFANNAGGTFNNNSGGSVVASGGSNNTNSGTYNNNGTTTVTADSTFKNEGKIDNTGGTFDSEGIFTNTGTYGGDGSTFNGDMTNTGQIGTDNNGTTPAPETMTFNDGIITNNGGTISLDIWSTSAYDQIIGNSAWDLTGVTLNLIFQLTDFQSITSLSYQDVTVNGPLYLLPLITGSSITGDLLAFVNNFNTTLQYPGYTIGHQIIGNTLYATFVDPPLERVTCETEICEQPNPTPEPALASLLFLGLASVAFLRRK